MALYRMPTSLTTQGRRHRVGWPRATAGPRLTLLVAIGERYPSKLMFVARPSRRLRAPQGIVRSGCVAMAAMFPVVQLVVGRVELVQRPADADGLPVAGQLGRPHRRQPDRRQALPRPQRQPQRCPRFARPGHEHRCLPDGVVGRRRHLERPDARRLGRGGPAVPLGQRQPHERRDRDPLQRQRLVERGDLQRVDRGRKARLADEDDRQHGPVGPDTFAVLPSWSARLRDLRHSRTTIPGLSDRRPPTTPSSLPCQTPAAAGVGAGPDSR